jgi:glycosyltransferase involved in cell wall biosynthesis
LREAYELATALIMPSFVETVGLPMLEAMNVGTPVLAANRPYAHDVSEDAALFFDPVDVSDLTSKVSALLSDKCVRENLVRKGRDLLRRRQSERPYTRMLDIVAAAASSPIQAEVRS